MRRPQLVGWLLFAAAVGLRVGWVLTRWAGSGSTLEFDDEHLHWQLATNLVNRGELVSDDGRYAARMPLYPLLLTVFAGLGHWGILAARLAQALLGAASTLLAYRFARAVCGARAGLVAGILVACDPYAVFFANLLLTEVPFTLIAVALVACAWSVASRPETARGPLLGVALLGAAAVLTRPSALGWILLLWLVLWLTDRHRRRAAGRLVVCAAAMVLLMLPWGLRNRAVIGSFAWLGTNGGVTLYDAQGPQADGGSNQAFLENMPELAGLDEVARDRTLRRLAVEQMRRDPGRALRLACVKFGRTWSPVPNVADYRAGLTGLVSAAFTGIVLALAAGGVARAVIVRRRAVSQGRTGLGVYHALLWLPIVYFTLVHCVFVGSLRYRVPLMPMLALAGAAALLARRATPANSAVDPRFREDRAEDGGPAG